MITFNVVELSEIFEVDKQTLRSWLRNGRLHGVMLSCREGYSISDRSLFEDFFTKEKNFEYRDRFIRKLNGTQYRFGQKVTENARAYLKKRGYL